jgi:hypothetical protein
MTLPTDLDPREMDLIDKVAKRVAPQAFTERTAPLGMATDEMVSPRVKAWDDTLRREARSSAAEIIKIVRDHDATSRAEKEGT